jgi:hypothetical protein
MPYTGKIKGVSGPLAIPIGVQHAKSRTLGRHTGRLLAGASSSPRPPPWWRSAA